ncbi:MAG: hypothetical protein IKO27_07610 [Ruminococcus sp.]|nr:hypothetical protein [Ruminococcus sp.]
MRKNFFSSKLILFLAIGSFIAAVFEGALYYSNSNLFFNTLLIFQNGINAFMFKPSISLTDAMNFIEQNNDILHNVAGYMYGVAVFTAPYCTVAAVYRLLENILRVMFRFRKNKKWRHVLIFGFGSDVKAMLDNYVPDAGDIKSCVHIITSSEMSSDMRYSLGKRGFVIHNFDILSADDKTAARLLLKAQAEIAENIILFSDNSVTNFSLLQMFSSRDGDGKFQLRNGAKITCRCDDDNISEIISDYYNTCGGAQCRYDLDIVSIPELQIRKMFETVPLHSYYAASDVPLAQWDTRMLILGFGALGRQALIRTIEQAAVHKNNKIIIDLYDTNIKRKFELFANRFSSETFLYEGSTVRLSGSAADGELVINCHDTDVTFKDFYDTIMAEHLKQPYTYAMIGINNVNYAVGCAMRLSRLFSAYGSRGVPTVLRMDIDRRLAQYINDNSSAFADVHLLEDRNKVLTLEYILAEKLDRAAKQFHYFYSTIQVIPKDGTPWSTDAADADALWRKNTMFKRRSSKALAAHSPVKKLIFDRLARETGSSSASEKIDQLIGTNGSLMRYDGSVWRLNDDEDGFLKALQADEFALAAAELEHRRWCCFVAADGWRYGKKRDDGLKIHDCLMDFESLLKDERGRSTIIYDLMPLMAEYLGRT